MPVRGTTVWNHAIIDKKIINFDRGGTYVLCAWDTCERHGYETNKCVEKISRPGQPLLTITYVFCSERHRQYFINSTRDVNNLPPGFKRSII